MSINMYVPPDREWSFGVSSRKIRHTIPYQLRVQHKVSYKIRSLKLGVNVGAVQWVFSERTTLLNRILHLLSEYEWRGFNPYTS